MTNPDFRALCEELVDSVELLLEMRAVDAKPMAITEDRVSRARAALAEQPVWPPMPVPGDAEGLAEVFWNRYDQPEPVAPTNEELMDLAEEAWVPFAKSQPHPQGHPWDLVLARAVLARWG